MGFIHVWREGGQIAQEPYSGKVVNGKVRFNGMPMKRLNGLPVQAVREILEEQGYRVDIQGEESSGTPFAQDSGVK